MFSQLHYTSLKPLHKWQRFHQHYELVHIFLLKVCDMCLLISIVKVSVMVLLNTLKSISRDLYRVYRGHQIIVPGVLQYLSINSTIQSTRSNTRETSSSPFRTQAVSPLISSELDKGFTPMPHSADG